MNPFLVAQRYKQMNSLSDSHPVRVHWTGKRLALVQTNRYNGKGGKLHVYDTQTDSLEELPYPPKVQRGRLLLSQRDQIVRDLKQLEKQLKHEVNGKPEQKSFNMHITENNISQGMRDVLQYVRVHHGCKAAEISETLRISPRAAAGRLIALRRGGLVFYQGEGREPKRWYPVAQGTQSTNNTKNKVTQLEMLELRPTKTNDDFERLKRAAWRFVEGFQTDEVLDLLEPEHEKAFLELKQICEALYKCNSCEDHGWICQPQPPYVTACTECQRFESDAKAFASFVEFAEGQYE